MYIVIYIIRVPFTLMSAALDSILPTRTAAAFSASYAVKKP